MSILCSIHQLSLIYPEKICFESFDATIYPGQRIALIGDNGCGKTSLLRLMAGGGSTHGDSILFERGVTIGYVPQIQDKFDGLSGAERFQKALSEALSCHPDLLILDEPTNHLDTDNRKQLLRFLQHYHGTLLMASHDEQLLSTVPDSLWFIHNQNIEVFNGRYEDFLREKEIKRTRLNQQLTQLKKEKKDAHQKLMAEQTRAKSSKAMGNKSLENRKWPTIVSHAKMHRASATAGRKGKQIRENREDVLAEMKTLETIEQIEPKFYFSPGNISNKSVLAIKNGVIGYEGNMLNHKINLQVSGQGRMAITGANGCGKSTLLKAIMNDSGVIKHGEWLAPQPNDIGYLDQHYHQLSSDKTVLSTLESLRPDWSHQQLRSHLNDFLFKSNAVVNQPVSSLSGGEKARLSLARIAAQPPRLLILDEVSNNLDITTKAHVIQCLKDYPGPMIVISHDEDFLQQINVLDFYRL